MYSEDLYNADTEEEITLNRHGSDGARKRNYFEGYPVINCKGTKREKKVKSCKAAGKNDVTLFT